MNNQEQSERATLNILLDFHDAANIAIALPQIHKTEKINPYQLDTSAPIIDITDEETNKQIRLLNTRAMSEDQKQDHIKRGALDLSNENLLINMIKVTPGDVLGRAVKYFNKKTHNVDKIHVLGDISGLNVELATSEMSSVFNEKVDLTKHKKYPFSQTHGQTEFVFWGEGKEEAFKQQLEIDNNLRLSTKTIDLNAHDPTSHIILSAHGNPKFLDLE